MKIIIIHPLESSSPGSVLEHKAKVDIQPADTGNRRYSSALGRFFRHLPSKGTEPPGGVSSLSLTASKPPLRSPLSLMTERGLLFQGEEVSWVEYEAEISQNTLAQRG